MAPRYRKLDPRCWDDKRFVEWDDGKRNLWLLLILGPSVEVVPGLQTGGVGSLSETLRRPYQTVRKQFAQLLEDGRVQVDEQFRLIRVNRAPLYNQPANPNQVRGWFTSWVSLPESPLKYYHISSLREACELADSEYSPATTKPKKGPKVAHRPSSRTPFMDAFYEKFGSVDVDARLAHLNGDDTVVERVPRTVPVKVLSTVPEANMKQLPEPLGDSARSRTRERTPDDLDLDLGSGSGTGSGAGDEVSISDLDSESVSGDPPTEIDTPVGPPSKEASNDDPKGDATTPKFDLTPPPVDEKKKPGRKPGTKHPLPDDWKPNDDHRELAKLESRDIDREVEMFRDDAAAKRKMFVDWDAAFRNWLRSNFGKELAPGGLRRTQTEEGWEAKSNPECAAALERGTENRF